MKGFRIALFIGIGIVVGYFFHDFFDQNMLAIKKSIPFIPNSSASESVLGQANVNQFESRVSFTDNGFVPNYIRMKSGNYVVITNTSKTVRMKLESTIIEARMNREFGESEQLRFALRTIGTHTISNTTRKVKPLQIEVLE